MNAYRRFTELLHRTIGLDAASLGDHAIERAVDRRAADWFADGHADATLADYWEALHVSADMQQMLVEAIVVPETWFYRDRDAFAALARLAVDQVRTHGASGPVRVLSLPCSTGEEPYTIAMTLFDAGLDARQFRIDALDVSERALSVARHAVYGRNSFRGNQLAFRDAHFSRDGEGWRLAPRIVDSVRFSRANLMQLDASLLGVYDFVFCRNLLIYFDRATQHTALRALDSVLDERGTLFVGPAETGLLMRYGMQSAKIPLAFAFHRATPNDADACAAPSIAPAPVAQAAALALTYPFAATPAPTFAASRAISSDAARQPAFTTRPPAFVAAPAALSASALPAVGTVTANPLHAARSLADAGRLDEALAVVETHLKHHEPDADAFYLLGMLADARGDAAQARTQYRRALYLDPQHTEVLTHLAALLELEGDRHGARLLMQRADRAGSKRSTT